MLTILKCLISNVDAMDIVYWSFIFLSLRYEVSAQYLEIQAKPTIVDPTQDDLVILCSTTAASDIEEVYTIQLKKNTSGTISYGVAVSSVEPVWFDTVLQTRATAIGSTNPPSAAYLKFTIPKANIHCPDDFTEYWCQMYMILNGTNSSTDSDHEDTNHISVSYKLEPTFMEKMRVRILGEVTDTANRKFAVGTALQLTCTGEVGSEPNNTIRWCFKTAYAFIFTPLPHVPVLSDASPSGCQYIRSSTVTYNMTNSDIFTQFLCESGTPGLCETGTAKQYLKITSDLPLVRTTLPTHTQQLVAFYARMSSSLSLHSRRVIIFDDVVTNMGNGYNGNDGVFTVPQDGVYVFIWHIRSSGTELYTELMVNNANYGSAHIRAMNHLDDSVSGNVVAHVNKEDRVFIRVYFPTSGSSGRGNIVSDDSGKPSFSGWLLQ